MNVIGHMLSVTEQDAQGQLLRLIEIVAGGEDVMITRDEKPIARLTPPGRSLRDLKPISVGRVLKPLSPDDDILDEMLNHDRH